jgi:hypothetical protein
MVLKISYTVCFNVNTEPNNWFGKYIIDIIILHVLEVPRLLRYPDFTTISSQNGRTSSSPPVYPPPKSYVPQNTLPFRSCSSSLVHRAGDLRRHRVERPDASYSGYSVGDERER